MFVNEEGYITGSVDVSKLDSVKPKSDEAKAQLEALKRENQEGQKATQSPDDNRDAQGKSVRPARTADDGANDADDDEKASAAKKTAPSRTGGAS